MFDDNGNQSGAFTPQQPQAQQDPQQQQPQYQQPQQQPQEQMQQFDQPQQFQQPEYQQPDHQQPEYQEQYQQPQQQQTDYDQYYGETTNQDVQQGQEDNQQYEEAQQHPQQPQDQYQQPQPQEQMQQQSVPVIADANKMDQEFEAWMEQTYPMPELPKIEEIDGNDPQALAQFFNEFNRVTREQTQIESVRDRVKSEKENYLWNEVHTNFPHLSRAPRVQATLRQLYAGARSMGQNVTPLQVTQQYVQDLNNDYRQGYQAANTQKTIRRSQPRPRAGGSHAPAEPAVSQNDMKSLSTSGGSAIENAAAVVAKMRAARQGGFQ